MSRAKPAHIPPRRVGQDPTREAETEGVSVAGTAKAAGRPTGREDRSPQGSRLGTRLDAKHESPVDAQQRAARISLRPNWTTLASHTGTGRKQLDGLHEVDAQQGFYAQIHEIFRLLKVPMAYAQSIPAKIASKSIGLRLSLKA